MLSSSEPSLGDEKGKFNEWDSPPTSLPQQLSLTLFQKLDIFVIFHFLKSPSAKIKWISRSLGKKQKKKSDWKITPPHDDYLYEVMEPASDDTDFFSVVTNKWWCTIHSSRGQSVHVLNEINKYRISLDSYKEGCSDQITLCQRLLWKIKSWQSSRRCFVIKFPGSFSLSA